MQSLKTTLTEAEQFFEQCNREYPIALSTYDKITQTVDSALAHKDYTLLLSQISYMESGNGYLTFQYIGEARWLLRILNIIALEEKYHTHSFFSHADDRHSLIEKYKLSLFALRRILFNLSEESVSDATAFLLQSELSPFAIYMLIKEELIIPEKHFLDTLISLHLPHWSTTEQQLFKQLISTFPEAQ